MEAKMYADSLEELCDFTEVIETHSRAILKYCNSILCDFHEAQDASQTTFVKAYTKRQYFTGEGMSAWLYKIAYNTCLDILRKRKFLSFFKSAKEGSYEMKDNTMSEELRSALLVLKPRDRALVFSRVIDGLDYKELQKIYGASENALHKRFERAKKKLAQEITNFREVNQNG